MAMLRVVMTDASKVQSDELAWYLKGYVCFLPAGTTLRYVNLLICLLMLLFIGVQYNDPDGPMWMLFYGIPAVWAGLAFFKKPVLGNPLLQALLIASILLSIAGVIYFWPASPRWWASEVWYETETAREGMGMMIVTLMLLVTWWTTRRT